MSGTGGNGAANTFQALIDADRKKRKNQELAQRMLGSGRRNSAPGGISKAKTGSPGSLASRVGVAKGAAGPGKANINGQWTHDLHENAQAKRVASAPRGPRGSVLQDAIERDAKVNGPNSQANIEVQKPQPRKPPLEMSIKGKAQTGPFCVVATNFVPGTTASDLYSAFRAHGNITSCKIVSAVPQVTAELVIPKRDDAENIVNMFNDSIADGNQLYVYLKQGPPSIPVQTVSNSAQTSESGHAPRNDYPQEPQYEEPMNQGEDQTMQVDEETPAPTYEEPVRDRYDEGRLDRGSSYTRDEERYRSSGYQDGRYGFNNHYDRNPSRYRPSYNPRPRYDDRYRSGHRWR